jgi:VWA domain-containing protein/aerotolerance regulator-like protein
MNFLTPIAFAFAAAIPVVVIFYLLKRKRVVKLVSSTLLWQRFLADTQASSPFQRLRHNWLLIFQILLLLLAVFALARPYFRGQSKETRLRVLILDGSASMQATDEEPSRFEKARAEALKWVNGMRDGEQMMVLLAGASTEVKQSPTTDKGALRRAIESSTPSDAPAGLADALKTAGAFTYEKRGEEEVTSGEIHLFSDGAVPPLTELENKNLPVVYHRIGQVGNNAGIVSMEVRANPEDPKQRAVFAAVANFSTNVLQGELELRFDGELIQAKPVELTATNTAPFVFVAPQAKDGVFTVRLAVEDILPADNEASAVSLLPQPIKVLLATRGNRFLEKALRGLPNVELSVSPIVTEIADTADLVVMDDITAPTLPRPNLLLFHVPHTNLFPMWDVVKAPPIVDWKNTHPLLRFVNFDNVQVGETLGIKPPAWGVSLVESPQTPLLVAGEIEQRRVVWVGFDPLQSTWPLRISFPIFIANAVDWLNPATASASHLMVKAGQAFRLTVAQPVSQAEITGPDGVKRELQLGGETRELVFGDTAVHGVYRLKAGTNDVTFCVNVMDPTESNITPREELSLGRYQKVSASTIKRANLEIWRWIAAGALVILLFEWWFYHKRTA